MQMNRYFVCCEQCFETIGKRNTTAARLWMDLCGMWLSNEEALTLKTTDFPELRMLEILGFIVSTDRDDGIAVCIKGHIETDDGQHFFCLKEGRHE